MRLAVGAATGLTLLVGCDAAGDPSIDAGVVTDSIDCSEDALTGGDEAFVFTSAYRVVDGELGDVCFGEPDPLVVGAWDDLVTITPPDQLGDLVLFAGFEPNGAPADDTFAFVNAVDADGTGFQMSINLVEADADQTELLLTVAHEFTHVFATTPTELDRSDEAFDGCDTYLSFDGCFVDGSLIDEWVGAFWSDDMLATVDNETDSVGQDADAEAATDQRCAADDGFFGSYAATNPEEDFAEAFSAFVFDLEPLTDGQAARLDWIEQQPGLVEFRTRARDAGLTPIDNGFDICGS